MALRGAVSRRRARLEGVIGEPMDFGGTQSEVRGTRFSHHRVGREFTGSGSDGTLYCPFNDTWEVVRVEGFGNRIEYFERMLADNPDSPTGLLALANEYRNADRPDDEAAALERYLSAHPEDEGNAYLRLGDVLAGLGRDEESRDAYGKGIRQAEKYGHSGMAEDLRLAIARLGGREAQA